MTLHIISCPVEDSLAVSSWWRYMAVTQLIEFSKPTPTYNIKETTNKVELLDNNKVQTSNIGWTFWLSKSSTHVKYEFIKKLWVELLDSKKVQPQGWTSELSKSSTVTKLNFRWVN